jgi:hypothetical protein
VKRSTAGQRTVGLTAEAVTALREHKARQADERLAAGPLGQDHDLVFPSEVGTPVDPSNVRRFFTRIGPMPTDDDQGAYNYDGIRQHVDEVLPLG